MAYTDDDLPDGHAAAALRRIADALGQPVEAFHGTGAPNDGIVSAIELLRLWEEIPDAQARRRVLSQLRYEVERCQAAPRAAE